MVDVKRSLSNRPLWLCLMLERENIVSTNGCAAFCYLLQLQCRSRVGRHRHVADLSTCKCAVPDMQQFVPKSFQDIFLQQDVLTSWCATFKLSRRRYIIHSFGS